MKSLVELQTVLLQECGSKSGAPYVRRDVGTLRERVKHEGDSFLTITLPSFCSDFERCLAEGRVVPGSFPSFRKERSGIPSFLKGFLYRVFDRDSGVLLVDPSVDCIRSIRQICLFAKKVHRPCSVSRVNAAAEGFTKCEDELSFVQDSQVHRYFKYTADILARALFIRKDFESDLRPVHGPGAVADRISGNQKWVFKTWHERLSRVGFTYARFGRGQVHGVLPCSHHAGPYARPQLVRPDEELPVRVVFVPKTLKTPRVIAVEPVCMQYAQQALCRWIVDELESHPLTRGHVNFRDQRVNQSIALAASESGHLATIDMAEASDRVSLSLVCDLFRSAPVLRSWILACRSQRAKLPSGEVIHLKKFASMGSALCFPVESLAFYVAIVSARIRRAGYFPTRRLIEYYSKDVYVYGDDIIVPSHEAPAICDDLEALGFKVNRRKSFWTGRFRESCGEDCYAGESVKPIYFRHDFPASRADASALVSNVATANQLSLAGFPLTAAFIRKKVERILGSLPMVSHRVAEQRDVVQTSAVIGWFDNSVSQPPVRSNRLFQRREYLCWVAEGKKRPDVIGDDPALAKCFTLMGSCENIDKEHLLRSARPYSLTLKRRWVPTL